MSEQAPSPAMSAAGKDPGDPARRKHFVHVYAVVRVKVEVDAENHRATMAAADERLFGNGFAVSLNPRGNGVIEADYAGKWSVISLMRWTTRSMREPGTMVRTTNCKHWMRDAGVCLSLYRRTCA